MVGGLRAQQATQSHMTQQGRGLSLIPMVLWYYMLLFRAERGLSSRSLVISTALIRSVDDKSTRPTHHPPRTTHQPTKDTRFSPLFPNIFDDFQLFTRYIFTFTQVATRFFQSSILIFLEYPQKNFIGIPNPKNNRCFVFFCFEYPTIFFIHIPINKNIEIS